MIRQFAIACLSLLVLTCSTRKSDEERAGMSTAPTLFHLLDSSLTTINFVNNVVDGENFNILTYRNYYNGGGVAIGDINNDGLPDIYFTSNQGPNKLYLNNGSFVFEDITARAGVSGKGGWTTGVTMGDVNGDGYLDIYVCNSGDLNGELRANELFINNGDLTFTEQASSFNLDNTGYSTHAAFFDYDIDGDLDCYILNNSFKDPAKIELYKKAREQAFVGGDKLMRNDGMVFTDVTRQAGIYSSEIGFGLGVAVSDINNDQLPDIYISNDFWERDYLYINQGDGKFSEELIERVNYCSTASMGADIADINNDGDMEIFTTDMLPADNDRLKTTIAFDPYHLEDLKYRANFHYQMTQNCLHLNDGTGSFQEIGLMSGVAATDWSWGALIFDFENDGNKDIFVSNGILKDIMSMDFREFLADPKSRNRVTGAKGKFDYRDFIALIPSKKLKNYAFHNPGGLRFRNIADSIGLGQPSFSNGSAYGDLDNDGDHDLVVNNIGSPSFIYRNDAQSANHYLKVRFNGNARNVLGIGCRVTIKTMDGIRTLENHNTRGFQSSIEPVIIFGLGKTQSVEELEVIWPDKKVQTLSGISADQTLVLNYNDASTPVKKTSARAVPAFEEVGKHTIPNSAKHAENRHNDFDVEILLPRMLSTEGPRLITGDVNLDKREDFVLLGAAGDPDKLFLQQSDGTFYSRSVRDFVRDAGFESTCGALLDHDNDGDLDLLIASGGNEIENDRAFFGLRYYQNDGKGNFFADMSGIPPVIGNFSTLEAADFDSDGDVDVFLGARTVPGNYGLPPRSFLFVNDNQRWIDVAPPSLANTGMVTDATWTDVDGDSDNDLVVVGDWMAVSIFKNNNGVLADPYTVVGSNGWWTRIQPADLDKDGDIDFVLGNWGLNTKFQASATRPLEMFVNDFDDNGKSEFIINWYAPEDTMAYPFATKPELTSQLPGLRKNILKYEDYADQQYESLFSENLKRRSIKYHATFLESAVLWNEGSDFKLAPLPIEAQVSPVFGIVTDDFDEDGHIDIWLGGNFYALKPQVGRHDASRGVLLRGGPKKKFAYESPVVSGIYVDGEVRDACMIMINNRLNLLVGRNNQKVLLFAKAQ